MALTTIPSELSSVSGISDSSTSTAITIDSSQNVSFAGTITATAATQAASDNSTKLATTAYVTTALANLVDSAPSTLDTLNELAAALGDDANFSTTVTNSIATKLPLAGGTMTGALNMGSQNITNAGTLNGITTTQSVSGTRWGVLPEIAANGVMEIGRYIDFHATSGDTSDYGARFDFDGSKMILTSAMQIEGATTLNNNVSIGTVNTARKLNIKSGTRNATTLAIEDASSTEEVVRIGQQGDGDGFFQLRNTAGAGNVLFDASGINYINSGNFGIGDTNPATELVVKSSDDTQVQIVSGASNDAYLSFLNGTIQHGFKQDNTGLFTLNYYGGGSTVERIAVKTDGSVGIGTTNPSDLLSIEGSGNTAVSINTGNNSGDNSQIKFGDSADDDVGQINYDHGTNAMQFRTNGAANTLILDNNGHVGIGATPDTTGFGGTFRYLGVNGGIGVGTFNGQTSTTNANQEAASFFGSTTGSSGYKLLGGMQVINHVSSASNAEGAVRFYTATGGSIYERMRIDNSGNVEILNNVGVTVKLRRNDTDVVSGEVLGQHYYSGDDPSATKTTHIDRVSATGTWSANYYPSKRAFWFDQAGTLLETFSFYRDVSSGHAIQQLQAGTSASASLRLANDSVNWQVDCRTDDHFAIYNATNARTNLFAARNGTQLGFGTVHPRSDIQCTSVTAGSTVWGFGGGISSSNTTYYVINQSNVGVYLSSGGQAWVAHSDERIKENITNVGTVLPSLMNMRCVKYNLKSNPGNTKIGFIAQDWESAFPEVVDEEPHLVLESDGTIGIEEESESTTPVKAMAYTETIPLLLKAIQEQQALIEELQTKVAALEGE